jgi:hypothetical protein
MVLILAAQPPAGREVVSEFDKKANFAAYHTYAWQKGWDATNSTAHTRVVTAIEKELTALGMQKGDAGSADLTIAYHSLRTTEVNMKEVEQRARDGKTGMAPSYDMGKLLIIVKETRTDRRVWSAHTIEFLNPDESTWDSIIQRAVSKLFETYPTRRKK